MVLLFCIIGCGALFNRCVNHQQSAETIKGAAYAGSEKCIQCHSTIYASYLNTAHAKTSMPASLQTIKGSFDEDSNTVIFRPGLMVKMIQRDSLQYQMAFLEGQPKQAASFDVVVGSGNKGQSYLYWFNNLAYQLPVSYHAPAHAWMNNPGYAPGIVSYNRNIPIGCFECHSSYIKKTGSKIEGNNLFDEFDKNQIVYGIDCERCHGPAADHVAYHQQNKTDTQPMHIAIMKQLNRIEQLDQCALCHSGSRNSNGKAFFYKPGDKVSKYLAPDTATLKTNKIDVHGKQYQLLVASQCFLETRTLTCTTCHNVHEAGKSLIDYSEKCISCHNDIPHSFSSKINTSVTECISCHMPTQPSKAITMLNADQKPVSAMVRTHYISVYPEATERMLQKIEKH